MKKSRRQLVDAEFRRTMEYLNAQNWSDDAIRIGRARMLRTMRAHGVSEADSIAMTQKMGELADIAKRQRELAAEYDGALDELGREAAALHPRQYQSALDQAEAEVPRPKYSGHAAAVLASPDGAVPLPSVSDYFGLREGSGGVQALPESAMAKVGIEVAPQVAEVLGYDGTEHAEVTATPLSEREFWEKVDAEVAVIDKMLQAMQADGFDDARLTSRLFVAAIEKLKPAFEARGISTQTGDLKKAVDVLGSRLARRRRGFHLTDARAEAIIRELGGDEKFERVSKLITNDQDMLRLVGTDKDELCRWARALAKQWHAPPGEPKTANNLELLAMNVAHVTGATMQKLPPIDDDWKDFASRTWRAVGTHVPEFDRVMNRCGDFYLAPGVDENEVAIGDFLIAWRDSAYAKLEVGHKLAAALCLTDTAGVEIEAPWPACSIVVPDGLIEIDGIVQYPDGSEAESAIKVARVWCLGARPLFVVEANGKVHAMRADDVPGTDRPARIANAMRHAIINLAHGAMIALANPEDFKKQRVGKAPSPAKREPRSGPPDFAQDRYLLSKPLAIDLRDELAEHLRGRRGAGGGSPKVQFLVRGHYKQQAHGPRHSLRKTIWVEPFWKGPEETRVLLRHVKVEAER